MMALRGPFNPKIARLGLGLAALGRPGYVTLNHARDLGGSYDPSTMELHAHDVLDAALEAGIRYVDAARSYGRSEDFVASWLRKRAIEPGEITVASKWGYTYTAGWSPSATQHEVKEHSLAAYLRQLHESIERLGPYLSLYQIHSVTAESKTRPWADVVLTGAATVGQVQSNVGALELAYDPEPGGEASLVSIDSTEYWRGLVARLDGTDVAINNRASTALHHPAFTAQKAEYTAGTSGSHRAGPEGHASRSEAHHAVRQYVIP